MAALALVQAGAGIALVDEFSVRNWPTHQLIVRPVVNAPVLQANLVHPRFDPLSTLAQRFVRVLRELMQRQGFESPHDTGHALTTALAEAAH